MHPIVQIRRNNSEGPLEDESLLGYASFMPKIKEGDGTIDTTKETFLSQLKEAGAINRQTAYFDMQKDINQVILGAERNTTKWKKGTENLPAVKLVIEKENNIFI
jgi:hypothetical protein